MLEKFCAPCAWSHYRYSRKLFCSVTFLQSLEWASRPWTWRLWEPSIWAHWKNTPGTPSQLWLIWPELERMNFGRWLPFSRVWTGKEREESEWNNTLSHPGAVGWSKSEMLGAFVQFVNTEDPGAGSPRDPCSQGHGQLWLLRHGAEIWVYAHSTSWKRKPMDPIVACSQGDQVIRRNRNNREIKMNVMLLTLTESKNPLSRFNCSASG